MATIEAKKKWNQTAYRLIEGREYKFSAAGQWIDGYILTDAKGFERFWLKPFKLLRRFPNGKWFSLIRAIDRNPNTQFDIGFLIERESNYIASATGTLYCFANDVSLAYFNNKGAIELTIESIE